MNAYCDGEIIKILEYIIEDGEPCVVFKYEDGDIDVAYYEQIDIE